MVGRRGGATRWGDAEGRLAAGGWQRGGWCDAAAGNVECATATVLSSRGSRSRASVRVAAARTILLPLPRGERREAAERNGWQRATCLLWMRESRTRIACTRARAAHTRHACTRTGHRGARWHIHLTSRSSRGNHRTARQDGSLLLRTARSSLAARCAPPCACIKPTALLPPSWVA
jgi:hypothetical protein